MNTRQILFSVIIVLSFSLALTACGSQTASSPLSASLSELEGTVTLKLPGQQDFSQATADSALVENGQVQTGDDGRVRLDLSSGTIIRVAPSSLFTLVSNEAVDEGLVTKLKLEVGEIFIILNGGSMDVETPSGVASVRGSFMHLELIEVSPGSFDVVVTCLEGDCGAENEDGSADLIDFEKTILFHADPVTGLYTAPEIGLMTPEDFQKWLDNNPEAQAIFLLVAATKTAMAPTATEAPATPEPVVDGSAPPGPTTGCMKVLNPPAGSSLPQEGPVDFDWEAQDGAAKYILTFHYPGGGSDSFETTDTNLTRYIESIQAGGTVTWDVTAVNSEGGKLCTTEPASFSKPESKPEPEEKEEEPLACTTENAQWESPELPCYCFEGSEDPWCYASETSQ